MAALLVARLARRLALCAALLTLLAMPARAETGRDQALIEAARAGDLARVEALLAAGASPKARDGRGATALCPP